VALLAGVTAALAALAWPAWPELAVRPEGGRECRLPVADGEPFGLSFVHSVDHLPVQDWYRVEDGSIVQDATRLRQFGAGMGHISGDGTARAVDGWWEVADMRRPIGVLTLRVGGESVDHRLHHPGGVLALSEHWAGHRLVIEPARRSTFERAWSVLRGSACPAPATT
jgi:hypothetical protein